MPAVRARDGASQMLGQDVPRAVFQQLNLASPKSCKFPVTMRTIAIQGFLVREPGHLALCTAALRSARTRGLR
jgi:hypothetical protein